MISGRVLDTSMLIDLSEQRTAYAAALIDTAASLGITLLIPAAALMDAWQHSRPESRPLLDLLPTMPTAIVADVAALTAATAGAFAADAGQPDARSGTVQAVHLARVRDWPVITADVAAVLALDPYVPFESLP